MLGAAPALSRDRLSAAAAVLASCSSCALDYDACDAGTACYIRRLRCGWHGSFLCGPTKSAQQVFIKYHMIILYIVQYI